MAQPDPQPVPQPDPMIVRMAKAAALGQAGDREAARAMLAALWEELGPATGDPLHRCALAHTMADVQDEAEQALIWDLRALEAADQVTDGRAAASGAGPVATFYPSLHLNLAQCYDRLGQRDQARTHLDQCRDAISALPDDDYGRMIRDGLRVFEERLGISE